MPPVAGLFSERATLLVILVVILHSLTTVTGTLTLDWPKSTSGTKHADIFESAQYPLLAIVTCNGGPLEVSVNEDESIAFGSEYLRVQLEENSNKPSEFFLLPNNTGEVLPEGEFQVVVLCGNASDTITVNIHSTDLIGSQPYFTNSSRTINISDSTSPGTVIAYYIAEFPGEGQRMDYCLHPAFSSTPFVVDLSTGQLTVSRSLQLEGTLSTYDIVVEANEGAHEAWTLTTITITPAPVSTDPTPTLTPTPFRHSYPTIVGIAVGVAVAVLVVAVVIVVLAIVLVVLCCCRNPRRNDSNDDDEYVKANSRVEVPLYPNPPYDKANDTAL